MDKSVFTDGYAIFLKCLKSARKEAGLSQVQLAERLGQTQSWLSKVERGERRVDVVELRGFCRAMGVSFAEFVCEFDRKAGKNESPPV